MPSLRSAVAKASAAVVAVTAVVAGPPSRAEALTPTVLPRPEILLTFDDGGEPRRVRRILDTLRRHNVRAGFFPSGVWAESHRRLVERMRLDGHLVGNHTYSHRALTTLSDGAVRAEIRSGVAGSLLRPPYGASDRRVRGIARDLGYRIFNWSIDTRDWDGRSSSAIVGGVIRDLHRGAVVLMHLFSRETERALPDLIRRVRARGHVFQRMRAPGAQTLARGDFDGDGRDDLAIGVPGDRVGGRTAVGSVNVLYGTGAGLRASGDQLWHRGSPGVRGAPRGGDAFGSSLASGDFDADGRNDLAVGAPGDAIDGALGAGSVTVLYGSPEGLRTGADQMWHRDSAGVGGAARAADRFGASLATGDFDGNGRDDLAIGAPGDRVGGTSDAGAVTVLYGSGGGLRASASRLLHRDSSGIAGVPGRGDRFGAAVAAGDFDGDGRDDLAIGAPGDVIDGKPDAGALHVLFGSTAGVRTSGSLRWHRDSPGVPGALRARDWFGASLAAGDFGGDGRDDLVAGAPGDGVDGISDAGSLTILSGSSHGPVPGRLWHRDSAGVPGAAAPRDHFGATLAAADMNGDGRSDLAVGVPDDDVAGTRGAGSVTVLYAAGGGLASAGAQLWHRDSARVAGEAARGDVLGGSLAAGDYDGDGDADLAVGVAGDDLGAGIDAGSITVLYASGRLRAAGDQRWHRESPGIRGRARANDWFGATPGLAS